MNGVGITVFRRESDCHSDSEESGTEWNTTVVGHSLSSECGNWYFRCQDLLVDPHETLHQQDDNFEEFSIIIFIPLENAVLLFRYWNKTMEPDTFIVDSPNCSPTVIYKADSKFYTVCINSTNQHIAAYEVQVRLNRSVIEDATLQGPLTEISNTSFSDLHLTDFVLSVSNESREHMVYFAVDNSIFVMAPLDSTQTKKYPADSLPKCSHIHKLALATGNASQKLLLIYCTDRYIYFDPVHENWTEIHSFTYSRDGIPYLCPDKVYKVVLFNNTEREFLQFTVTGSQPYVIYDVNINAGLCFENENGTHFTYADQQHNNIFVFDFKTWNHYSVSPYECSTIACPQLFLVDSRYIVVRNTDEVIILDAKTEFSPANNISHEISDMLTILIRGFLHHVHHDDEPTGHNKLVVIIATVVTGTVIIVLIILFVGLGIQLLRKHR